jgi:ribonucleoside-diphosphate reductase beta chain
MTFKDAANRACNQTARAGNVVHLSNLCTEILEVTNDSENAVCNLGSTNLTADGMDWDRLRGAVRFLDRTIDRGFYPTPENAPEAQLYLSRQMFEEAVHVQFYLTLLDTYLPDDEERVKAFAAVENIPSIQAKAEFCFRWIDSLGSVENLTEREDRRTLLLNVIRFAACIEGLFFYGAFSYVYWLRSGGLLKGLASGTNWVFRDESMHMDFAFGVVDTVWAEEPSLFDEQLTVEVTRMMEEAMDAEFAFAEDLCGAGLPGMTAAGMRAYLENVADQRLTRLGMPIRYGTANPFAFMELQDVQELSIFFERRVSAYQVAVEGTFALDEAF